MAFFSAPANTAVNFNTMFDNLDVLTNAFVAYDQQSANGFNAYLNGQEKLVVTGNGFSFTPPVPVDGAITTLLFKNGGATLGTLSGLAVDYSDFLANLANHGNAAAVEQLLKDSDTILGSSRDDVLFGKGGDDVISGFAGNDRIYGDDGKDTLYGGDNDDQLFGGAGNDFLDGEAGDDIIYGGGGSNKIDGGSGNDTAWFITDAPVRVTLNGATEALVHVGALLGGFLAGSVKNVENIVSGNGNDAITGDANQNLINGSNGNDTLRGGAGDDRLLGSSGDDSLFGDNGSDQLEGSNGNDLLDGGLGADTMEGGSGDDTYVVDYVGDTVSELAGKGTDTVLSTATYTLSANVENLTLTGRRRSTRPVTASPTQ